MIFREEQMEGWDWVFYMPEYISISPKWKPIKGKYMFFSKDKARLIYFGKVLLKRFSLPYFKWGRAWNNSEWCMFVYDYDNRYCGEI